MRIFPPKRVLLDGKKPISGSVSQATLLFEHLLQVANFTLHRPPCFFCRPAIAQVWVSCCVARLFFHFALCFPKSALDLVLCARFHKNKIALYDRGGRDMFGTSRWGEH